MQRRTAIQALGASLATLALPAAFGQTAKDFPAKPIRIIVPFAAGSGADADSRAYGDMLSRLTGQSVLVENRPGASAMLGFAALKALPADGYTMILASNSPMAVMPLTVKNMPLDPFKDIRPICGMGKAAVTIVVAANSPYKTVREMTDAARAADRPLNAGNYSAGYQLVNTWVSTVTGAKVTHVNYKGGAQMLVDVMGGQLDFASIDATGPVALAKDGKVRILAITSDVREPSLPQVPTMKESGYADFETWTWTSFYVRAETPDPVVNRLAELMQQVLDTDEAKAYAKSRPGSRLNAGPEEMRRFHRSEYERFKKVAEAAGVKPE